MEFCAGDAEACEFFVTDGNPGFVAARIDRGANGEARLGGSACYQIDDDFVCGKRSAAPVLGNEAEQPMLDFVPFAGARRKVVDMQCDVQLVGQRLQGLLLAAAKN